MGGLGSGNRYRFSKKTTIEECHSLVVRDLYREGLLKPGTCFRCSWSRAGIRDGLLPRLRPPRPNSPLLPPPQRIRRRAGGRKGAGVLGEWTVCNFGGERPWFAWPGVVNGVRCGRRVAILYGRGKYFLCRHCYDLSYESQREDKNDRALRRARKIRVRLGGSANMLEPFPERPKGMPLDTYMRLFWKCHEAEMEELAGMREGLDELKKRVG